MLHGEVWFYDLEKALKVFREKVPEAQLFSSIEGNIYGDFNIFSGGIRYIITHNTFKIYRQDLHTDKWEIIE